MNKKVLVLVGFLLATLLILSACGQRVVNVPPDSSPAPVDQTTDEAGNISGKTDSSSPGFTSSQNSGLEDPESATVKLIGERTKATEFIRSLEPPAELVMISLKYINSLSNQTGLATNFYIYSSSSHPNFYYLVNAPRSGENMKRFIMPVEDLQLDYSVLPIPLDIWTINYAKALQSVEEKGGAEFRARHKSFEVSAILAMPATQFLSWYVSYKATDGTGEALRASVDAHSGQVQIVS